MKEETKQLIKKLKGEGVTLDQINEVFSEKEMPSMNDITDKFKDVIRLPTSGFKMQRKIVAIRNMIAVAEDLNEGWEPDWSNVDEDKFLIFINEDKSCKVSWVSHTCSTFCFLKSRQLAEKAIEILGEETIKTALS